MKVCLLTQTLDAQTGTGVFVGNIVEGVRRENPQVEFSVITGVRSWFYIRKEIKKADVVHAIDGYPYGVLAMLAGSRPIITAVGSGSLERLRGFSPKSILLRLAYQRATQVTAISHYVAEEIRKVLPSLAVQVINPGVDYEFYAQAKTVGPDSKYLVTQGEFKKRKGYEQMLKVAKEVMDTDHDLRLVIVGNTSRNQVYLAELYKLMNQLGIRERVEVRSGLTREELRETYAGASLYLALPRKVGGDVEGFGMAILEAAATGTPAVVGRGSGADDAVLDGKSGFLVDGSNRQEVVAKVSLMLRDEGLRTKLSTGAQEWARENNLESKAREYLKLYSSSK